MSVRFHLIPYLEQLNQDAKFTYFAIPPVNFLHTFSTSQANLIKAVDSSAILSSYSASCFSFSFYVSFCHVLRVKSLMRKQFKKQMNECMKVSVLLGKTTNSLIIYYGAIDVLRMLNLHEKIG